MPSKLFVAHIGATPGNTPTSLAPPAAGHKYRLLSLYLALTCDGTVATRNIAVDHYVAGTTDKLQSRMVGANVLASGFSFLSIHQYAAPGAGTAATFGSDITIGVRDFLIDESTVLNIEIVNGVAGDSYAGHILLEDIAP